MVALVLKFLHIRLVGLSLNHPLSFWASPFRARNAETDALADSRLDLAALLQARGALVAEVAASAGHSRAELLRRS